MAQLSTAHAKISEYFRWKMAVRVLGVVLLGLVLFSAFGFRPVKIQEVLGGFERPGIVLGFGWADDLSRQSAGISSTFTGALCDGVHTREGLEALPSVPFVVRMGSMQACDIGPQINVVALALNLISWVVVAAVAWVVAEALISRVRSSHAK